VTTRRRAGVALLAAVLLVAGCGRAQGVTDTRRALEGAGYREVEVTLRTGGGIGVARVEAAAKDAPPTERAAEVAWATLPVRFDQLVVALGDQSASYSYEELAGRFGRRDASLDRRQVDQEVVESGLKLMLLLSGAAILSVGAVVVTGLLALRAGRRARRSVLQAEAPGSGLGAASAMAEGAAASETPDEMPS
jgi:hypothetical protein